MKILSLITLGNGVKLTFEIKQNNFNLYSGQWAFAQPSLQQLNQKSTSCSDDFGQRIGEAREGLLTTNLVGELYMKDNQDIIEVKDRLWFEMDEPTDKEMRVTVYEVPKDSPIFIDTSKGKETTFHQSSLRGQHMLLPGTYIFTFSNDQYTQLSVVLNHNKLSFEEN